MENKCLYCYNEIERGKDYHAKCSNEFFGYNLSPSLPYSIDEMADLAKEIVERSISITGVQPKLSMSLIKDTIKESDYRLTVIGALDGNYILKPPSTIYPEMPANEHVTMRIAEAFGIKVVPSSLIRLQSGELSYITKRIDRNTDGSKIHMIDMFQITEAYDKYRSSLEKVGKAIHTYSDNTLLDKILFFELVLFCFITGNNDMHLKNFSMIKGPNGWLLSPAYDLLNVNIVNPDDTEELALTLEGKKKKLKRAHFDRFAKTLDLSQKQISNVYSRMINNKPLAVNWINSSFLSSKMKKAYTDVLDEKYKILELV